MRVKLMGASTGGPARFGPFAGGSGGMIPIIDRKPVCLGSHSSQKWGEHLSLAGTWSWSAPRARKVQLSPTCIYISALKRRYGILFRYSNEILVWRQSCHIIPCVRSFRKLSSFSGALADRRSTGGVFCLNFTTTTGPTSCRLPPSLIHGEL